FPSSLAYRRPQALAVGAGPAPAQPARPRADGSTFRSRTHRSCRGPWYGPSCRVQAVELPSTDLRIDQQGSLPRCEVVEVGIRSLHGGYLSDRERRWIDGAVGDSRPAPRRAAPRLIGSPDGPGVPKVRLPAAGFRAHDRERGGRPPVTGMDL